MGAFAAHWRTTATLFAVAAVAAGCGGGSAQDVGVPHGLFPVAVDQATFPGGQALARNSDLVIVVHNPGRRTIPDVNVTLKCGPGLGGSFQTLSQQTDVADPRRPQFVVNTIPTTNPNHRPGLDPSALEHSSALADTYPLGQLGPGRTATFRWNVTAVAAGPYHICYRVNTDVYGDAKPVAVQGSLPLTGGFSGTVSNTAPKSCIGSNDQSVTTAGCK